MPFETKNLKVVVGPWKTVYESTFLLRRMRFLAYTSIINTTDDFIENDYILVQVEERIMDYEFSSYKSFILIGNLVDDTRAPFSSTIDMFHYRVTEGFWCAGCWQDDMYGNRTGGILIPLHYRDRYFTSIKYLNPCHNCKKRYDVLNILSAPNYDKDYNHIFKAVINPDIQACVESALAEHGVYGTIASSRPLSGKFTREQHDELLAEVFAPSRIMALVDAYGQESLVDAF
jgi:hypothetical protein